MMADHPVYRVTWGANPEVIEGKSGVLGFYNSVGEAVLWNADDLIAVADWGVADELTFHQIAPGAILKMIGYPGLPATYRNDVVAFRGKRHPKSDSPKSMEDFA